MKRLFYRVFQWWFRRSPFEGVLDPKAIQRILILRYDAIGDMIVTIPMIDYLRVVCPGAQIDVVSSPSNDQIIEHEPAVHSRYVFERTFGGFLRLIRRMPHKDYNIVFSLVINKTTLAGLLSNVLGGRTSVTVSFEHPDRRQLYQTWFNVQVPHERGKDVMTLMQLHLVESIFGERVDASRYPLRLSFSEAHQKFAMQSMSWMTGRRIVLNLSAGNAYRMWSEERNASLIDLLLRQEDSYTVALIGYGERHAMAERIAARYPERVKVIPEGRFLDTAACLTKCDVLITPDTSMVHAASAVGTPVLVMFTRKATFIDEWMPHGTPFEYVITNGGDDLEMIEPVEVVEALNRLVLKIPAVTL
ncbi:MAG: glycosyltransferase family 9 protein [Candidatus Kapabacteria bacterium]|nr:glycosyltransferase family 9 protein [Candidatus Kapabacteria bacterium]